MTRDMLGLILIMLMKMTTSENTVNNGDEGADGHQGNNNDAVDRDVDAC